MIGVEGATTFDGSPNKSSRFGSSGRAGGATVAFGRSVGSVPEGVELFGILVFSVFDEEFEG